jgi:hypothetical protein
MLAPRWTQIKIGPLLRGETDLRCYTGQFCASHHEVGGLHRYGVLATHHMVPESQRRLDAGHRSLIVFEGVARYFEPLNGYNAILRRELESVVRPEWLDVVSKTEVPAIGIHVRLGDFAPARSETDFITRGGIRTPVEWFAGALQRIRSNAGNVVPAFVVSDGRAGELSELLSMPAVTWLRSGSAISDLLLLAKAKIIIASGGSTFSAWAAFLGEIPAVSIPGQSLTWFHLRHSNGRYVGELPFHHIPSALEYDIRALNSYEAPLTSSATRQ